MPCVPTWWFCRRAPRLCATHWPKKPSGIYLPALYKVADVEGTLLEARRQDVLAEVEESRYYVVLLAYDFQDLLSHKPRKLLWETRYSIPVRGADFDRALAQMSRNAASYFGQSSDGRVRQVMPDTKVIVGPLRVIGEDGRSIRSGE